MKERTEFDRAAQELILEKESRWTPVGEPLGEGGGARVFRVIAKEVVNELKPAMRAENTAAVMKANAQKLIEIVGSLVAGERVGLAAAKVVRFDDPRTRREIALLHEVRHPRLLRLVDYDERPDPPAIP